VNVANLANEAIEDAMVESGMDKFDEVVSSLPLADWQARQGRPNKDPEVN
jgi:hypothetical protein